MTSRIAAARAELDGLVVFVDPDRVAGRPVVRVTGMDGFLAAVGISARGWSRFSTVPQCGHWQRPCGSPSSSGVASAPFGKRIRATLRSRPVLRLDADAAGLEPLRQAGLDLFHGDLLLVSSRRNDSAVDEVIMRATGRNLQAAWRIRGDFLEMRSLAPNCALDVIYAPAHALPVRQFELDMATVRAARRRRAVSARAAGVRAARAAGREPRAPGLAGRDHREGLGRARRLRRRHREPHQVGAAGARRRRQGAALHPDDPRPGLPLRRSRAGGARRRSGRGSDARRDPGRHRPGITIRRRRVAPVDRRAAVSPASATPGRTPPSPTPCPTS